MTSALNWCQSNTISHHANAWHINTIWTASNHGIEFNPDMLGKGINKVFVVWCESKVTGSPLQRESLNEPRNAISMNNLFFWELLTFWYNGTIALGTFTTCRTKWSDDKIKRRHIVCFLIWNITNIINCTPSIWFCWEICPVCIRNGGWTFFR